MRSLFIAALTLVSLSLYADIINVTMTQPLQSFPAAELTQTRLEFGTCNGNAFAVKQGEVLRAGAATSIPTPDLAPGTYCFRAFNRRTVGGLNIWSDSSNVIVRTVVGPAPSPAKPLPPQLSH